MTPAARFEEISEDAIFRVGKVVAVDGRIVRVKVDKTKNTSHLLYRGELLKNIVVGSYIKICKGFVSIIGKVDGEFVVEEKFPPDRQYGSEREKISRTLNVKLLGYFEGAAFKRGIKELPLVDNECFLLHVQEFNQVHNFIKEDDEPIVVGALSLERGQQIAVGVNALFASHIGIFGNTGSGKSYTLTRIYRSLFEKYKDKNQFKEKARFVLIDFNGEYVDDEDNVIVERKYKNIYKMSTRTSAGGDKYPISGDALNDPDFWVILLEATEKTQKPFLRRSIAGSYAASVMESEESLRAHIAHMIYSATTKNDRNIEKGVVTSLLTEVSECFGGNASVDNLVEDYRQHLQFHSTQSKFYYQSGTVRIFSEDQLFKSSVVDARTASLTFAVGDLTPIGVIKLRIVLTYYNDIIMGYANREHLAPLMKRMDKRLDDLKKVVDVRTPSHEEVSRNITVISLRDVSLQMKKILPLLFCKRLYEDHKAADDDDSYLNLIIDEAHNILSEDSERESEQWKDYRLETFEEIIKEGRKFGVFLTIASQRPADISPTIISQLHNYFLHRLINNEDIKAVERTISYLDKLSFESLPILPTGTCIFAGLLATVPVVVDILEVEKEYEPRNKTRTLTDKWG